MSGYVKNKIKIANWNFNPLSIGRGDYHPEIDMLHVVENTMRSKIKNKSNDSNAWCCHFRHTGVKSVFDFSELKFVKSPAVEKVLYTYYKYKKGNRNCTTKLLIGHGRPYILTPTFVGDVMDDLLKSEETVWPGNTPADIEKLILEITESPKDYLTQIQADYYPPGIFNPDNFKNPLHLLCDKYHKVFTGIRSMLYLMGGRGSISSFHKEDNDFGSINVNLGPGRALWFFVYQEDNKKLLEKMKEIDLDCPAIFGWKNFVLLPSLLTSWGIRFHTAIQEPHDIIVTMPGAYHFVVNLEFNIKAAVNFVPSEKKFYKIIFKHKPCPHPEDNAKELDNNVPTPMKHSQDMRHLLKELKSVIKAWNRRRNRENCEKVLQLENSIKTLETNLDNEVQNQLEKVLDRLIATNSSNVEFKAQLQRTQEEMANLKSDHDTLKVQYDKLLASSQASTQIEVVTHGFPCPKCGKEFASRYNLKMHVLTHDEVVYACSYCSKEHKSFVYHKKHEKTCLEKNSKSMDMSN